MVDYLEKIRTFIKNILEIKLDGIRAFIEAIIKVFLIILIIMSIARIGSVLIYQIYPPIPDLQIVGDSDIKTDNNLVIFNKNIIAKSQNITYYAKYEGKDIDKNRLSLNLTRDEESFAYVVNLNNPREPGQIYSPNLVENMAIAQATNLPLPINIHREFIVKRKINFENFYSNLSFNFIRNEIGMLLFLIILINIYSLVPSLIGDRKTGPKNPDKKLFCYLILTSLILALILTLSPEGDIGEVKLNISLGSAISAFLIIISFILVYLFMENDDFRALSNRKQ